MLVISVHKWVVQNLKLLELLLREHMILIGFFESHVHHVDLMPVFRSLVVIHWSFSNKDAS
jgi:hypothetical protein